MRNLKYIMLAFMLSMSYVSVAIAQHITVSVPAEVSPGENFRLSYTVNTQNVEEFRAGNIPSGLEVVAGPYTSSQSSYQMVNGHTSSSSSVTFTYTVCATKNGSYTIPSAHAVVNGKHISSKTTKVHVSGKMSKGSNSQNNIHQQQQSQPDRVKPAGSSISGSDLFIKVSANKKRVHEQEPVLLTYKVYTQVSLTQLEGKMPDLDGFHTQEIKMPQQKTFHRENFNGKTYNVVTWSQYIMYPQMTGKLKVPSITFKGIVVEENRNVDPFEAFFNGGSGYVEVHKDIVAPSVEIQVDPLPSKPAKYSGAVGHFNITSSANKTHVKAGDPITVHVVLSGNGNLKLVKAPDFTVPKDWDKYDPKIVDHTKLTSNGVEGSMVYDYIVVPSHQGVYTIPEVLFNYYDITTNTYRTIKTKPISIEVAKGDVKRGSSDDFTNDQDKDIHNIKEGQVDLKKAKSFFFGSTSYLITLVLLFTIFIGLVIIFRKRAIANADVAGKKARRAQKVATKKLRKANNLMLAGKQGEFYDEVLRALWGYVSDKLNMPVEQLSRENIQQKLEQRQVESNTIMKFTSALDECEFERYAPGDPAGNMNKTFESAMTGIIEIEQALKK